MRNALNHAVSAIAVVVVIGAVFLFSTQTGESQANAGAAGQVRRTADGKPDFSGIWQANSLAHWDLLSHDARPIVAQRGAYPDVPVLAAPVVALGTIGWIPADVGVVEGDEIPYQPWAAARQKENFANWLDRDPEIKCYLPGVPRAMYMPYKFQIIQGTTKVMMAFEFTERGPHHPPGRRRALSRRRVHGALGRQVGRRHAGGERVELYGPTRGSIDRETSTATGCA